MIEWLMNAEELVKCGSTALILKPVWSWAISDLLLSSQYSPLICAFIMVTFRSRYSKWLRSKKENLSARFLYSFYSFPLRNAETAHGLLCDFRRINYKFSSLVIHSPLEFFFRGDVSDTSLSTSTQIITLYVFHQKRLRFNNLKMIILNIYDGVTKRKST
jgi:hypothetical protein